MREILFRGRRMATYYWVEGSLLNYSDGDYDICSESGMPGELLKYAVYPETVGQLTGLTDKNGNKIFEGDIIRSDNGEQSCVAVVKFGEYFPKMFYKMLDMFIPGKRKLPARGFYAESVDKHEEMILFQSPCVTVIGNIHDNPELLEGTDNA